MDPTRSIASRWPGARWPPTTAGRPRGARPHAGLNARPAAGSRAVRPQAGWAGWASPSSARSSLGVAADLRRRRDRPRQHRLPVVVGDLHRRGGSEYDRPSGVVVVRITPLTRACSLSSASSSDRIGANGISASANTAVQSSSDLLRQLGGDHRPLMGVRLARAVVHAAARPVAVPLPLGRQPDQVDERIPEALLGRRHQSDMAVAGPVQAVARAEIGVVEPHLARVGERRQVAPAPPHRRVPERHAEVLRRVQSLVATAHARPGSRAPRTRRRASCRPCASRAGSRAGSARRRSAPGRRSRRSSGRGRSGRATGRARRSPRSRSR